MRLRSSDDGVGKGETLIEFGFVATQVLEILGARERRQWPVIVRSEHGHQSRGGSHYRLVVFVKLRRTERSQLKPTKAHLAWHEEVVWDQLRRQPIAVERSFRHHKYVSPRTPESNGEGRICLVVAATCCA